MADVEAAVDATSGTAPASSDPAAAHGAAVDPKRKNSATESMGSAALAAAVAAGAVSPAVAPPHAAKGGGAHKLPVRTAKAGEVTVGNYLLGATLGEGTFGKVKLGTHVLTGEKVAVKILEKSRIVEAADVTRVTREIAILKRLRHRHVIQLYEVIDTRAAIFLIMEFCDGGELFDYIVKLRRVPEREACRLFHQLIDAADYLHSEGIIHRDLKPENLLLQRGPTGLVIKVVDFGLSNTVEPGGRLKTACGSPCYAAPEMIAGKAYIGSRTDMWSMGVILFALVCGFLPFEDSNTSVLYRKILSGSYRAPKFLSRTVRDLIRRVLETNADRRYTISHVRRHPWYTQLNLPIAPPMEQLESSPEYQEMQALVLQRMTEMGADSDMVVKCLESRVHNQLTSTYHLLLRRLTAELDALRARMVEQDLSQRPAAAAAPSAASSRSAPRASSRSASRSGRHAAPARRRPRSRAAGSGAPPSATRGSSSVSRPSSRSRSRGRSAYGYASKTGTSSRSASPRHPLAAVQTAASSRRAHGSSRSRSRPRSRGGASSSASGTAAAAAKTPLSAALRDRPHSRAAGRRRAHNRPRVPALSLRDRRDGASSVAGSRVVHSARGAGDAARGAPSSAEAAHPIATARRPGTSLGTARTYAPTPPPPGAASRAPKRPSSRAAGGGRSARKPRGGGRRVVSASSSAGGAAVAARVSASGADASGEAAGSAAASPKRARWVTPDDSGTAAAVPSPPAPRPSPDDAAGVGSAGDSASSYTLSATSMKTPKAIMEEVKRVLLAQRVLYKPMSTYVLSCQAPAARFELDVSPLDTLDKVQLIRMTRTAGSESSYQRLCTGLFRDMRL